MSKKKKKIRPLPSTLGLPLTGVETHAHLDLEPLVQELDAVLARAREAGVARLGQVFSGPGAYRKGEGLFAAYPHVFFILGLHPHEAKDMDAACLADMERIFLDDARIKAVGEIGLDFYYDHSPREVQEQVFRDQLALAKELDKPVVIHSRDALAETLAALDAMGFKDRPLLWHCFGGGPDMAREVLSRGWHVSIPGPVTYSRSQDLREAVARIPLERLVLETDCPYLAPEPWRGKTNEPALMAFTAQAVATAKGIDMADVWTLCGRTAIRFFGLEPLGGEDAGRAGI